MLVPGLQGEAAVLGPVVVEAANSTDGTTVLEVQEEPQTKVFCSLFALVFFEH